MHLAHIGAYVDYANKGSGVRSRILSDTNYFNFSGNTA